MIKNTVRFICFLLVICAFASSFALVSCEKEDTKQDESSRNDTVYSVSYKGVEIVPGAKSKPVIEKIDEEYAYEEVGSCVGDGKDKRYSYSSLRIETVNNDGVDYISAIYLINDLFATKEGLTIGSPEADIEAKYGDGCSVDNGVYTYEGKDKTSIRIFTKDGAVFSICYLWN